MLFILAPMAVEAAGIQRALRRLPDARAGVRVTGIGRERIAAGVAQAAAEGATAILAAGFCGALDPALRAGDLHIAGEFHANGHSGDYGGVPADAIPADARLTARLRAAAPDAAAGPSVTVAGIAQPDAKATLWQTGAGRTVNMEDYWAAQAAAGAGLPFASVRAVLDTAGQSLPDCLAADNITGGAGTLRLALGVAGHPGRAPALARLARQSRQAQQSLTRCVMAAL